jgi:hypothetical protein
MYGLVIRNQVAAVVNDYKLETQVSLAVTSSLVSHNPKASCSFGPMLGATPIHTVQQHLTALCTSTQVAVSIVNQYLNFGVIQKLGNVRNHRDGSILLQVESSLLMLV